MTDTPERAVHEAENWLASARHILMDAAEDEARVNVCCAQAIHAIIRANDALSLKFLGHKATRHDDAAIFFSKIVRQGKLPENAAEFKNLIAQAMRDKSGADYGKGSFSCKDAQKYVEQTGHFVMMVKDVLKL
ncbi:MAG: hypothetical protein AB1529_00570 [Candidatus Micrarchaeota archaeon]